MITPRDKSRDPLMPHERDEGTGAQSTHGESSNDKSRDLMRRAHDDVESGREDTDRGPVADRTYHELRKDDKK
ncbi:hypothetical protein [Piscinibacter terrae]|uniref:Uncharacterized protein n=1 Tax=Piscinibacter terrae TaxID=2496871 RepID=A0A3N7HLG7_9BURK|nr:hypothetical protein [Albitalea terrae]RQP22957.1 hypothetical protein DZC73_17660 [Albitalea terrae]